MRTIAGLAFPDPKAPTEERIQQAEEWEPQFFCVPLHRQFVLLAKTRIEGAWSCCGVPVSGETAHLEEAMRIWDRAGQKIDEDIARAAFPRLEDLPYAG